MDLEEQLVLGGLDDVNNDDPDVAIVGDVDDGHGHDPARRQVTRASGGGRSGKGKAKAKWATRRKREERSLDPQAVTSNFAHNRIGWLCGDPSEQDSNFQVQKIAKK